MLGSTWRSGEMNMAKMIKTLLHLTVASLILEAVERAFCVDLVAPSVFERHSGTISGNRIMKAADRLLCLRVSKAPTVLEVSSDSLDLAIELPCSEDVYKKVIWQWKKLGVGADWKTKDPGYIRTTMRIEPLEAEKQYRVRVLLTLKDIQDPEENNVLFTDVWTCSDEQGAVSLLSVYAAGGQWIALRWIPPHRLCLPVIYDVSSTTKLPSLFLGQRNKTTKQINWVDECAEWPGFHCANISVYTNKETIEVKVNLHMSMEYQSVIANVTEKVPSRPVDLKIVEVTSNSIDLTWRCPAYPGGLISHFHLKAVKMGTADKTNVMEAVQLQKEYTAQVKGLEPSTLYNVSLRMRTGAGEGEEVWTMCWTAPGWSNGKTAAAALGFFLVLACAALALVYHLGRRHGVPKSSETISQERSATKTEEENVYDEPLPFTIYNCELYRDKRPWDT